MFKDANRDGEKDQKDRPIPGAIVHLTKGGFVLSAATGPDGQYTFECLGSGVYSVNVQASSMPTKGPRVRVVTIAANDRRIENFGYSQFGVNGVEVERFDDLAFTGSPTLTLLALALVAIGVGGHAATWRRRTRQ